MFQHSVRLFSPFGIEIHVHASWILLAALCASSLATGWLPSAEPSASEPALWFASVLGAGGLFASIIIHELAHALVGRRMHVSIERITLILFGGVTRTQGDPPGPGAEFAMSAAGPAASLVCALLLAALADAVPRGLASSTLSYLGSINLVIAAFNLLPGYPLDGGRMLRAALWKARGSIESATRTSALIGQAVGICLLSIGMTTFLADALFSGAWLAIIGLLLIALARGAYLELLLQRKLSGKTAAAFMNATPATVDPEMPLSALARAMMGANGQDFYPVVDRDRHVIGCTDLAAARRFPQAEWSRHRIREIMHDCTANHRIGPSEDANEALRMMHVHGHHELLVVQGDRLLGLLTQSALMGSLEANAV